MRLLRPIPSRSPDPAPLADRDDRAANYAEAALVVAAACSAIAWCITLLS